MAASKLEERTADRQENADKEIAQSASSLRQAQDTAWKSVVILAPELKAGLSTLSSVDDDADGLTNTQEQWQCDWSWSPALKSS